MLFLTTTLVDLDEELLNRCITFTTDEFREQSRETRHQNGEGQEGELTLMGPIDVETSRYDDNKSGANAEKSEPSRPQVGTKSGPSRVAKTVKNDVKPTGYETCAKNGENGILGDFEQQQPSYSDGSRSNDQANSPPLAAQREDD